MFKLVRPQLNSLPVLGLSLSLVFTAGCNRDPNVRKQKYLESGKRYEQEGKEREALIQISNALKVDRGFAPAHYELGQVYLKLGAIAAAYTEMLRTVDLDPTNAAARLQVGNMQLAAGLPDRATEQVNAVLATDKNNADAYSLAANIAAQRSKPDEAMKYIQQALAIQPNKSEYHTTLALLESKDQDGVAQAKEELKKAIAIDNSNVTAHLVLASLLEKSGDLQGALVETQAAVKAAPRDLQARRDLAEVYLRLGQEPQAEQALRQASADLADTAEGASVLSDFYIRRGQIGAAESAYADLVGKNPKSFELRYAYARILTIEHKDDKAAKIAAELDKENPNSPEVAVLNAALLLNAGKTKEAFNLLEKATKISPDHLQLLISFARVSQMMHDEVNAELSLRDAAKLAPGNIDVQIGLADVANAKHDNSMLGQVAEATIQKNPNFPDAYVWRGTAEANDKQYDKAERDFQYVLQRNPKSEAALIQLGQIALLQKRIPDGLNYLERALDANPNSVTALKQIVQYYDSIPAPDKAIARIQKQLDAQPKNVDFINLMSKAKYDAHDFAGSRDLAKQTIAINPSDETAVQQYAMAVSALGDYDGAIKAWTDYLTIHPADGLACSMVAQLETQKGDTQKAITFYWKALSLDPGQAFASNNLAYLMVENGQSLDMALRLAQDARSRLPNSPNTADTLAWVYYARGRYLSARDLLEDSVKADPTNADAQYHLGMTYKKLGDKTNAALHLKRAMTLAPNAKAGKDAATALAQPS